MAKNEVKWGVILSYALIIINAVYGLIITPYVISSIGNVEYGVYKTISSLSSSLMVLDLGLGGTVMRYIAKYKSEDEKQKIDSFVSMALGEGLILISVITVVCGVMYSLLPTMYSDGLSTNELQLAKNLFVVMTMNLALHVLENLLGGIITGYNRFTVANGLKLARIVWRMILIYGMLKVTRSAMVLVVIDFVLTSVLLLVEYVYIRRVLHTAMRFSFRGWDKALFGESFRYTVLMFLTSVAVQVNGNLDNVVIGAMHGPALVTVYSIALLFFGMFENLSTAVSGVMLPTVTRVLKEENGIKKVQHTIIQAGRIQFLLLGAVLVGFAIVGRDFIGLWLGSGYEDVYLITLILMAPSLLELCVNVCLSVLRAQNMLGFRTVVLMGSTVLNALISIIGVYYFGYIAAAIGTACSFIIGSLIIMNIYFYKKLFFPMFKIYREIFRGTWLCLLISGGITFVSSRWLFAADNWISFASNVVIFALVYAITLLLFGLNTQEKKHIPILGTLCIRNKDVER